MLLSSMALGYSMRQTAQKEEWPLAPSGREQDSSQKAATAAAAREKGKKDSQVLRAVVAVVLTASVAGRCWQAGTAASG